MPENNVDLIMADGVKVRLYNGSITKNIALSMLSYLKKYRLESACFYFVSSGARIPDLSVEDIEATL
jgi:hypothetical protein